MAHDFSIPGCTVYVWNPKGALRGLWGSYWETEGARVGHSAIRVGDGNTNIYLSFWPEHAPKSSGINSYVRGYMHNNKLSGDKFAETKEWASKQNHSLDEDEFHEGSKPDQKFRFTRGLDWAAMMKAAEAKRKEVNGYNLTHKNCTHAVAEVLNAGNPPVQVPLTGWIHNVWQPGDMVSYCTTLKSALNKTFPNSATEKTGGVWA